MGLACRCISILLHLEGICLYMCACVCVRTCAAMFHLIEAPSWHPGQIDQLVCQLSWQISPSVSLFLKPTPLSLFFFFFPPWRSRLQFNLYTLAMKGMKKKKNTRLLMTEVVFLTSIFSPPPLDAFQRFHILPLADGCRPVLTDVTLAGTGCWRWPSNDASLAENDGQRATPSFFLLSELHILS